MLTRIGWDNLSEYVKGVLPNQVLKKRFLGLYSTTFLMSSSLNAEDTITGKVKITGKAILALKSGLHAKSKFSLTNASR